MSDNIQVQKYTGSDGRRVEQRITERVVDGKKERVVETHVEQVPVALEEKVVETIIPVVTERKREVYSAGQLVDTHLEKVADASLRMDRQTASVLTKEDIAEAVRVALGQKVPTVAIPKPGASIWDRVKSGFGANWTEYLLYGVIAANAAFVVYQLFLKNYLGQ